MFDNIQNIFVSSLNVSQIILNIFIAFIGGSIVSYIYRKTNPGPNFSVSYLNSLIILSMITSIVIMVIGNNLARAFGLVGAMSIIRFRTAVKDIQDIVFIFFSLAIGLAAGTGLYSVALIGSVLVSVTLLMLSKWNIMYPQHEEILVQFSFRKQDDDKRPYLSIFNKYCKTADLINIKSIGEEDIYEISYYIQLKNKEDSKDFVQKLKKINGIDYVNLLFDEDKL
ncbi:MAG: DUF4956 domain-containing protein [bacterium]